MTDKPTEYKRRVRYRGTHPRNFSEKYKELNPDKYPEEVQKVKQKGQTPVGMHLPVCVREIVTELRLRPGMHGIDCTLGYGGHSSVMLSRIKPGGSIVGIDVDRAELQKTENRMRNLGYDQSAFSTMHMNFSQIQTCLELHPEGFDFILADLGVSSMQLDTPDRGFSFKNAAPLDLRLNNNSGETAAELLLRTDVDSLRNMFAENSDEPHAALLAGAVLKRLDECSTTVGLSNVIAESLSAEMIDSVNHKSSIQRVFQALRIEINREFEALEGLLSSIPECLKSGGRVAILTFHSGEDRRVKKSFKSLTEQGVYTECIRRPIRPSFQEQHDNPRSSCAKLRWAEKS